MQVVLVTNNMPKPVLYSVREASTGEKAVVTKPRLVKPGTNELPAEEFEACTKKSPVWQKWIEDGQIKVEATAATEGASLGEIASPKAIKLVGETFDRDLIASWLDNEKRPDVRKALRKRDELLEAEFKRRPEKADAE
jgi:hypothetical protein